MAEHASRGRPLPAPEAAWFGSRFGTDFGHVRVHDDDQAADLVATAGARAFTVGSHVFFGRGEYRPATAVGRSLLAHELAHVEQAHDGSSARVIHAQSSAAGAPAQGETPGPGPTPADADAAMEAGNWQRAVRYLAELPPSSRRALLAPLTTATRQRLRDAARQLNPAGDDPVLADIEAAEQASSAPSPRAVAPDAGIADLASTEKLSRAWGYCRQGLRGEVAREIDALFSARSLAMMAAFAVLFIAAQLTPAGWVADAILLTSFSIGAFFLGWVFLEVVRDLYRFFRALDARSDQDLRVAGQALARAIARGGVAVVVALLTRGLRGAGRRGSPPPSAPAPVTAVTPEGVVITMPVAAAEAVVAARPALAQQLAAMSVMTPPPGGREGGGEPARDDEAAVESWENEGGRPASEPARPSAGSAPASGGFPNVIASKGVNPNVSVGSRGGWAGNGSPPQWANPKSGKAYGHIESTHGPLLRDLHFRGRIASTGNDQGQWRRPQDWVDAEAMTPQHPGMYIIEMGRVIGRVHRAVGGIVEGVTKAFMQRNPDGSINAGFPVTDDYALR